jgi:hypothetical protein
MRPMPRLLLVLLLTWTAFAATAEEPKSFTLKALSSRTLTRLQLVLHADDMKAIRVYAEPSHTLLGVFLNEGAPEPLTKSDWLDRTIPPETRTSRFPLASFAFRPDRTVTVSADHPKIGDDSVAIYVYRAGKKKKEEKYVIRTNPTEFTLGK